MGSFTTPLITEQNNEGTLWRLAEEFTYWTGEGEGFGDRITVPVNFVTDYLSIPHFLHFLIPPDGRGRKAAVVHDYLYQHAGEVPEINRKYSRETCDEIFREALLVSGVEPDTANMFYYAVRRFGARHFGKPAPAWDAPAGGRDAGAAAPAVDSSASYPYAGWGDGPVAKLIAKNTGEAK